MGITDCEIELYHAHCSFTFQISRRNSVVAGKVFETRTNVVRGIAYDAQFTRPVRNSLARRSVINSAITIRLFRTVLRDRLKNVSRYNSSFHVVLVCSRYILH